MKLLLGRTAGFVFALPLFAIQLADDAWTAARTRRDRARWNNLHAGAGHRLGRRPRPVRRHLRLPRPARRRGVAPVSRPPGADSAEQHLRNAERLALRENSSHERHRATVWAASQFLAHTPGLDPRHPSNTIRAELVELLRELGLDTDPLAIRRHPYHPALHLKGDPA